VNHATVIWHNLGRNKIRTSLTVGSIAFSLFLFTLLRAVVTSMRDVAANSAQQLRLVVRQKTTMTKLLPLAHGPKIAALPDVQAVCAVRWFGGRLADSPAQFPSLAAERAALPAAYPDLALQPDELAAWQAERNAALVGCGLAKRMGWTRGQRVVLRGTIPPYPALEFRIVGVTAAPAYPNLFVLALDYLLETLRADTVLPPDYKDGVNFYWVKVRSAAAFDTVPHAIDALFAHSPDRTRTEAEEAFVAQFTQMFGDIPRMLSAVGLVVIAAILLVAGNAVSMTIRDRMPELAVLKAIGFSSLRLTLLILGEAAALGLAGGLLGCLPAWLAFGGSADTGLSMPYFPIVNVSAAGAAAGLATGVLVGVLAGLAPLRHVAHLSVTATLREKE
jgi:putative ABC transport system permease protein